MFRWRNSTDIFIAILDVEIAGGIVLALFNFPTEELAIEFASTRDIGCIQNS